ncbi:MAG: tetratricopeptide repeat protein [Clostridiales bacterium]|nr:tetratricopeptide repeat protein [Clostridiales bacterium]
MRRKICRIILTGLCAAALTGCGKSAETEKEQLALRSQGMEQAAAGEYEAAVSAYNEALGLAGMHVGALELDIAAYKASAQYHMGETQKAIDTCSAVLDLKKSAELYLTRGLLYRADGNVEKANEDFKAAIDRTSEKDLIMLGRLSYYMEDYPKAKEYLEIAADEGETEALYWQAELYRQMGNEDYAVTLYQSYLDGEPQQMSAYAKVADWQIRQEDYDAALETLQAGIAKGDGGSMQELLANEIVVYEKKGDFETAKLKMESYLESYPDDEAAAREYVFLKSR